MSPLKILLVGASLLFAQKSADDFYHDGAAMYIEGRMQQAAIEVEDGLRKYPDDPKLKALYDQLKQLEDQQKQENQQQQDQGDQQEEKKDQDKQDKKEPEEQESQPEPEKQDTIGSGEEKEPPPEGEMDEEDAKRLLDAYKDDEKEDQDRMRKRKQNKVMIDW